MKPGHHAKILIAMIGLGLAAAACSSTSSSSSSTPATTPASSPQPDAFLGQLHGLTQVASTVPANGDVNPYGVAVVPASGGRLTAGDILVSNFNDKANVQGTGNTIVQVSPAGKTSVFASIAALPAGQTCPGGIGLTTALGILPGGWVVVGSLPTSHGGVLPGLDPAGCLIVLNDQGTVAETITNPDLVGPWDLTVKSSATSAEVFVSNALGGNTSTHDGVPVTGNCTVVRLDLALSPGVAAEAHQQHRDRDRLPVAREQGGAHPRADRPGPERQRDAVRGRHADQLRVGHPRGPHPDPRDHR